MPRLAFGRALATRCAAVVLCISMATATAQADESPAAPPTAVTVTAAASAPSAPAAPTVARATARLKPSATVTDRVAWSGTGGVDVGRPLPTDPDHLAPSHVIEHRLRIGGRLAWQGLAGWLPELAADIQVDVLSAPLWRDRDEPLLAADPLAGRPADVTAGSSQRIRKASLTATTRYAQISAGRTVSQWGLGLLAHDGEADPWQFGLSRDGHVVDRVALLTMPFAIGHEGDPRDAFPLVVALAWDWLVRDDLAIRADGDRGNNAVAALLYHGKQLQLGAYGLWRKQRDRDDLGLDVRGGDLFAQLSHDHGDWKLLAAAEFALLRGETGWFRSVSSPDHLDIAQAGGVVRLQAERGAFGLRLEGGMASGDANPYDGTVGNFSFARDYRVGLVLFGEVLRRTSAVSASNLNDPRFAGTPPAGWQQLASGGAVNQALYVHPVVRWQPLEGLSFKAGLLWARSPVDLVDPFLATTAGGVAVGPRGAAAARDLGLELDMGASWHHKLGAGLAIRAAVDAGWWSPGAAFDNADGKSAAAVAAAVAQIALEGTW